LVTLVAQRADDPQNRIWRHALVTNALVAGVYVAIALILPATAFANYRLATALYVLAAFDWRLIPGLALGNALAGIPQGPIDIIFGGMIGVLTAWACSRLHPLQAPIAVLVLPTILVPIWLSIIFGVPYKAVVPVVGLGQLLSALLAWVVVVPVGYRLFGGPRARHTQDERATHVR
jgi:uncharacterized membrane protein